MFRTFKGSCTGSRGLSTGTLISLYNSLKSLNGPENRLKVTLTRKSITRNLQAALNNLCSSYHTVPLKFTLKNHAQEKLLTAPPNGIENGIIRNAWSKICILNGRHHERSTEPLSTSHLNADAEAAWGV